MSEGAGRDGGLQREQFVPTQAQKSEHGKPNFLCRKIPVPVVGLVVIIGVLLIFLTTTIVLAYKQNESSTPPTPSVPLDPCPEGWIRYRGKCYFFSNFSTDWDTAQAFCESYSASLALIKTQQELDFLTRHICLSDHWIGLRREEGQVWRWPDGSGLNSVFNTLEPESGCAYLSDDRPKTASCTMNRNWICTKP